MLRILILAPIILLAAAFALGLALGAALILATPWLGPKARAAIQAAKDYAAIHQSTYGPLFPQHGPQIPRPHPGITPRTRWN